MRQKTDFPQAQSVQASAPDQYLVFNRTYTLQDGETDVRLFADSYFVLDTGIAVNADDFRSAEYFATSWPKRVFVSLDEMRRVALTPGIVYFLDLPDFRQALFISKDNQGQTLTIANCRGLASSISLFDWNTLYTELDNLESTVNSFDRRITDVENKVDEFAGTVQENTDNILNNAANIADRMIIPPQNSFFFYSTDGSNYLDSVFLPGSGTEFNTEQIFPGSIRYPLEFKGDALISLWCKATEDNTSLSVALTIGAETPVTQSAAVGLAEEWTNITLRIPDILIEASSASVDNPYPIGLTVTPGGGVSYFVGDTFKPGIMQLQGSLTGGGWGGEFDTQAEALQKTQSGDIVIAPSTDFPSAKTVGINRQEQEIISALHNFWDAVGGDSLPAALDKVYSTQKILELLAHKEDKMYGRTLFLSVPENAPPYGLVASPSDMRQGEVSLTVSGLQFISPEAANAYQISGGQIINLVLWMKIDAPASYTYTIKFLRSGSAAPLGMVTEVIETTENYAPKQFYMTIQGDTDIAAGESLILDIEIAERAAVTVNAGDLAQTSYFTFNQILDSARVDFPIGWYYAQIINEASGTFLAEEAPAYLAGGVWELRWASQGVTVRTEGNLASESRGADGIQGDQFRSHSHTYSVTAYNDRGAGPYNRACDYWQSANTSTAGGSETRMRNILVRWWQKTAN